MEIERNLDNLLLDTVLEDVSSKDTDLKTGEYRIQIPFPSKEHKQAWLYFNEYQKVYKICVNHYVPNEFEIPDKILSAVQERSVIPVFPQKLAESWLSLIKKLIKKYGRPYLALPVKQTGELWKPWYLWKDNKTELRVLLNRKEKIGFQFSEGHSPREKLLYYQRQHCYIFLWDIKNQEDVWRSKGWTPDYPSNWEEIRQGILERDGHQCKHCEGIKGPFHVHHIIPKECGGLDIDSNLETLCDVCHNACSPIREGDMEF